LAIGPIAIGIGVGTLLVLSGTLVVAAGSFAGRAAEDKAFEGKTLLGVYELSKDTGKAERLRRLGQGPPGCRGWCRCAVTSAAQRRRAFL
jgi:hypothetical protein